MPRLNFASPDLMAKRRKAVEDAKANLKKGGTTLQKQAWNAIIAHDGNMSQAAKALDLSGMGLRNRAYPQAAREAHKRYQERKAQRAVECPHCGCQFRPLDADDEIIREGKPLASRK